MFSLGDSHRTAVPPPEGRYETAYELKGMSCRCYQHSSHSRTQLELMATNTLPRGLDSLEWPRLIGPDMTLDLELMKVDCLAPIG